MIDHDEAEQLLEAAGHLFLADHTDAGPVARVYLDDYTGWPSFCTVHPSAGDTVLSAGEEQANQTREVFVALHEASVVEGGIHVPYDQDKVDQAPQVLDGEDLSISQDDALFDYYGVPIDGVTPVVEHLGAVLITHPDGDVHTHDVDHPPDPQT